MAPGATGERSYPDPPSRLARGITLNRPRILLADDEPDFLAVTARLLQPEFGIVQSVGDGQQVVDLAPRLDPDLLILDISMPVLSGLDAARAVQAAGGRAKVIFLTVHRDPEFVDAGFAAGASGYVIKSRLVTDLRTAIHEVLAGRSFVSPSLHTPRSDGE